MGGGCGDQERHRRDAVGEIKKEISQVAEHGKKEDLENHGTLTKRQKWSARVHGT